MMEASAIEFLKLSANPSLLLLQMAVNLTESLVNNWAAVVVPIVV